MSFPFYLILNKLNITEGEKFVFSILMGLTIFPSLVYIFGLIISFKISVAVAFIIFVAFGIVLKMYKKYKKTK